jgi:hypothetical protein
MNEPSKARIAGLVEKLRGSVPSITNFDKELIPLVLAAADEIERLRDVIDEAIDSVMPILEHRQPRKFPRGLVNALETTLHVLKGGNTSNKKLEIDGTCQQSDHHLDDPKLLGILKKRVIQVDEKNQLPILPGDDARRA